MFAMVREGDGIVFMDEDFSQFLKREMAGQEVWLFSPRDENRRRRIRES
jgi:hypothetical protein